MATLPPVYRSIIVDQQAQLAKLVRSAGVRPVKQVYEGMLEDITAKLKVTASGSFTAHQLQILLAQVKLGLASVQRDLGDAVESGASKVGIHAARTILQDAARLERHFTGAAIPLPLMEIGRLQGLVKDRTSSMMRVHESSMARFGVGLVRRIETTMASSLATGENHTQAIDRVMQAGVGEWHRAERIVRTELAYVANSSARDAADEQAVELDGDMWSRWTEHVTDDGTPLDDRVGVDSIAMNGQVAPPGGMFTQPPTTPTGEDVGSLAGDQWECPPNRPNDRAVLVPWRASWGIAGWRWEGARVPVTEDHAREQNERWMRGRRSAGMRPAEVFTRPAAGPAQDDEEEDDDEDAPAPAPRGIGFVSPVAPLDPELPRGGTAESIVQVRGGIGFESPVPTTAIPSIDDARVRQPTSIIDPAALVDRGWFESPGLDRDALARGVREILEGQPRPVIVGVTKDDELVVKAGRGQLNAAADLRHPVHVKWEPEERPITPGHVKRGAGALPPASEAVSVAGEHRHVNMITREVQPIGGFRIGASSDTAGSSEPARAPAGGRLVLPKPRPPVIADAVPLPDERDYMDPAKAMAGVQRPIAPWWFERTTYNGQAAWRDMREGKGGEIILQRDIVYPGNPKGWIRIWPDDGLASGVRTPPILAKPSGGVGGFFRRVFGRR